MTKLKKPISRRVCIFLDNRKAARERDWYTVTLHPGEGIGFRRSRSRHETMISFAEVLAAALKREAREKAQEKEIQKRAQGKRVRRIRRSSLLI